MEQDFLVRMFEMQRFMQKKLYSKKSIVFDQEYINMMSLALIDEVMESLRETRWKPWKKNQELNEAGYRRELIDAWHFLINLSLAANMTAEDIYNEFKEKNEINKARFEGGY